MKAIVTGANGFVGSHLVERLLKEGLQVVCLVRPTGDLRWIRGSPVEMCADGMDSVEGLAKVEAGADFVFHVAGLTRGRTAQEYMAANAELTRRLVEAAIRCGRTIRRFVYVSSMAAVGPNGAESPLDETCQPAPIDDYGRSKLAGERIVTEAGVAGRLPVAIVRPPGVHGPRDANFLPLFRSAQRWGILPAIGGLRPCSARPEPGRTGGRDKQFTLVHAEDLAEGLWLAASNPAGAGQTYFIGSGTYTMTELAAAMSAAIGRPLRLLHVPKPLAVLAGEFGQLKWALTGKPQIVSRRKIRDLLQPRWTCSWEKAGRELGYRERIALEEGLRQTALWYAAQGGIRPIKG
jgi:nucleoside-diphosphate-sugar epimerase